MKEASFCEFFMVQVNEKQAQNRDVNNLLIIQTEDLIK